MKIKYIRANNAPFMTKLLSKAIMNRSRLKNLFIKDPSKDNEHKYKKQRNYCVNLVKREKKNYYDNLDIRKITNNKQFWKTTKPFFSDKHTISKTITLVEGENIISDDSEVAEIMNNFFSNGVDKLNIQGFIGQISDNDYLDPVSNAINVFRDHPSIIKIKGKVCIEKQFSFNFPEEAKIKQIISQLNTKKPTTFNNIQLKFSWKIMIFVHSLFPKFLMTHPGAYANTMFPNSLKRADITPGHKKFDKSNKDNYRPVSILPTISKVFERNIFEQIDTYMRDYLSQYLCGFWKGSNTQSCLIIMLEKWRKALDKRNIAGGLLTDLSKAFDCLNHELLIAKLEAYGFDHNALNLIYSYLSNRKHRTKVNNAFST